jgi:hypothetical protein
MEVRERRHRKEGATELKTANCRSFIFNGSEAHDRLFSIFFTPSN